MSLAQILRVGVRQRFASEAGGLSRLGWLGRMTQCGVLEELLAAPRRGIVVSVRLGIAMRRTQ